jgi:hypothetical protein
MMPEVTSKGAPIPFEQFRYRPEADQLPAQKELSPQEALKTENGDPLGLLTPEEKQQAMTTRRKSQFLTNLRKLPPVSEFEAAAKAGAVGSKWYERSTQAFGALHDQAPNYFKADDADRFAGVVASLSPQQGVFQNLREALGFWKDWHEAGRPTTKQEILRDIRNGDIAPLTNQNSKMNNLVSALNGEDMLPGDRSKYYKVGNFAENLRGMMKNVTNDSWMGVFGGVGEKDMGKPQFYHAMALRTRQAAAKLRIHPAEAQAAIWAFTKTLAEMSGWKGSSERYRPMEMLDRMTPDKMTSYAQDFSELMRDDSEVRAILQMSYGVDLNGLDEALKTKVSPRPNVQGQVASSSDRDLRRAAYRIGKAQQGLEGFTKYSRPPAQGELELKDPAESDTSFNFTNPIVRAAASHRAPK